MELIVGIIGSAIVILVIFLISTLVRARKTLKNADRVLRDIHHILNALTNPTLETIHHLNKLTMDVAKKSESLDILFRPLYAIKKEHVVPESGGGKFSHLIEYVAEGIRLFNKVRSEIREKSK
jgi:hypothetical protein